MSIEINRFAPKGGLTSNQIAAIGVLLSVIELLRYSKGVLAPSDPFSDDHGADLYLHHILTGRTAEVQIKVRLVEGHDPQGEHMFGAVSSKTAIREGSYVLAVLIHLEANAIVRAWLVPTTKLAVVASKRPKGWVLAPSASQASKDKYARWRHDSMVPVAAELCAYLAVGVSPPDGGAT